MGDIISAEEAKLSLRLGETLDETDTADLTLSIAQAEAIYLTYHPESEWDDSSPPIDEDSHKAAVLLLLHSIWDNRGEDPIAKAYDLMRLNRGPALA